MNVTSKMFKDKKKWGNDRKQFVFVVGSCACFQSSRVHNNMSVKNWKTTKNNKGKGSVEEWTQMKVGGNGIVEKNKSKRVEREGVLNIQLLVVKSLLHSSSSLECIEGKIYNEKM